MKLLLSSTVLLGWLNTSAQNSVSTINEILPNHKHKEIALIPEPVTLTKQNGYFILPQNIIFNIKRIVDDRLLVTISAEVGGLDIYYSFNSSFPDQFYPKYTDSLIVPIDAQQLRVTTYQNKNQ